MKKILILAIMIISVNAKPAKTAGLACPSKQMYKSFTAAYASVGKDAAVRLYVPKGCDVIFPGTEVKFIESDWGSIKVIFESKHGLTEMWTSREVYF